MSSLRLQYFTQRSLYDFLEVMSRKYIVTAQKRNGFPRKDEYFFLLDEKYIHDKCSLYTLTDGFSKILGKRFVSNAMANEV
jgi:hypothetical protein